MPLGKAPLDLEARMIITFHFPMNATFIGFSCFLFFLSELRDYCASTRDCREYAYVCSRSSCECAEGYRADEKNKTCVGGEAIILLRLDLPVTPGHFDGDKCPGWFDEEIWATAARGQLLIININNGVFQGSVRDWLRKFVECSGGKCLQISRLPVLSPSCF